MVEKLVYGCVRFVACVSVLAAVLMVCTPGVQAFEGVQGRTGIFTPSVELIYEHTDNLYLVPRGFEESANIFVVRPHFKVEVAPDAPAT